MHNLVTIVFNNVVGESSYAAVPNIPGARGLYEQDFGGSRSIKKNQETAALGLTWSTSINDRIALRKPNDEKRIIAIEQSSFLRRSEMEYRILEEGLRGNY